MNRAQARRLARLRKLLILGAVHRVAGNGELELKLERQYRDEFRLLPIGLQVQQQRRIVEPGLRILERTGMLAWSGVQP
jgi:hypothetical protein